MEDSVASDTTPCVLFTCQLIFQRKALGKKRQTLSSKHFQNIPPYVAYKRVGNNFLSDAEGINRNSGI